MIDYITLDYTDIVRDINNFFPQVANEAMTADFTAVINGASDFKEIVRQKCEEYKTDIAKARRRLTSLSNCIFDDEKRKAVSYEQVKETIGWVDYE